MKNVWLIGISLLLLAGCQREPAYVIRGKFIGAPEGTMVYLGNDSTRITREEFVFKGRADIPRFSSVRVKGVNEYGMPGFNGALIWLENADMTVSCPWAVLPEYDVYSEEVSIKGSALNDRYQEFRRQLAALDTADSLWEVYDEVYLTPSFDWKGVDVSTGMAVMKKIMKLSADKRKIKEDFIAQNSASPISLELLMDLFQGQIYTVEEAEQMIQSLDTSLQRLPAYTEMLDVFQAFVPTAKGQKYMDVTLQNKEGKEVKLSDYIRPGMYNMLEFWASWCGPCRGEIPHLRHVHEVLGKRFNIISISLDEKDADWQKAMEEEKMVWTQLNAKKGFTDEAVQKYGVLGIPYSLVLDGDGNIIAGEVRGAELDIILTQLLGKEAAGL